VSSTDRSVFTFLAVALLLAVATTGCGRGKGTAAKRIVEREESVGGARVRLRSELMPARGTLGDPIAWHLSASVPEGLTSGRIGMDPPPPDLEIDTARVARGEYLLRGFGLGAIPLPRATLVVLAAGRPDTLEFPHDTLFVDSLSAQATGQIRPDRGPIDTPLRPLDVAVLIGAGVLLLALLLFIARLVLRSRRRAETALAPAPPEPPEAILERDLVALERELASLPRDLFYERLAQILRSYAAAVTGVSALDLTTSELDRTLARSEKASARGRELLIGALRRADLAKFARYEDEESEARSIVRQARSVAGAL
jgi:hypothetical protein